MNATARLSQRLGARAGRSVSSSAFGAALGVVVLGTFFAAVTGTFATADNLDVVVRVTSISAIVGMAQMVVIGSGGLNVSLGAIAGLVAVTTGGLMVSFGLPPASAVVVGIAIGTCCGVVNGLLITRGGLSPFIATLASGSIFTGINLGLTESQPYYNLPPGYLAIDTQSPLGVPLVLWVAVALSILLALLFRHLSLGRRILAVGANVRAAELAGVSVSNTLVVVHALSGLLVSCAAVMFVAQLGSAQPTVGSDWLLPSFAAPIIGGTLLAGGAVSVLGAFLGALLLSIIANGMVHLNVDVYYVQLLSGTIILGAALLDRMRRGGGLWTMFARRARRE